MGLSYFSVNVYWNMFNKNISNNTDKFYFGPFNSVNYINGFLYTAGFRMGIDSEISENVYYSFLGTELGYRNFNGKNVFYIGFKVDVMIIPLLFHLLFYE